MKKYLLLVFVLLAVCNACEKHTLSYFNFPIGKDIKEVKNIMTSAGFEITLGSPMKTGIAFEAGKFHGYVVDCILMNMGRNNNLESIHMSINNNAIAFYELSMNILKNNLGNPTTVLDTESHKVHWWWVRSQEIVLSLKGQCAVYSITTNPETFLYKNK